MKTDLREIKTQRAIQDALIQLLNEKPRSQITITELSQRAMINRKTFYRHYGSIDDVFDQIENIVIDGIMEICTVDGGDLIDLNLFFSGITNLLTENKDLYGTIIRQKSCDNIINKLKDDITNSFYSTLKHSGTTDEKRLRIAAEFVVSGILGLYNSWFMKESDYTLDELSRIAHEITLSGISDIIDRNEPLNSIF